MAAIIEFPTEVAIWRRRNSVQPQPEQSGKILIFSGIRYSRGQDIRRERPLSAEGKEKEAR